MTLWHKPAEKPRKGRKDVLTITKGGFNYLMYADGYPYGMGESIKKWCHLSDLFKLERENKELRKEIEYLKQFIEQCNFYEFATMELSK